MTKASGQPRGVIRSERGFTLIETLVAIGIVMIIMAIIAVAIGGIRFSMRNQAMSNAIGSVDSAMIEFDRMYPVVREATGTMTDELMIRGNGKTWTANPMPRQAGLADDAGNLLIPDWPANPYATGGVIVQLYNAPASCSPATAPAPGTVRVCRAPNPGVGVKRAYDYRIVAWGARRNGSSYQMYDKTHG